MAVTRRTYSTQNSKYYEIFLQYLKKKLCDEIDFWHADKHHRFPQVDTVTSDGSSQPCSKYTGKFALCL